MLSVRRCMMPQFATLVDHPSKTSERTIINHVVYLSKMLETLGLQPVFSARYRGQRRGNGSRGFALRATGGQANRSRRQRHSAARLVGSAARVAHWSRRIAERLPWSPLWRGDAFEPHAGESAISTVASEARSAGRSVTFAAARRLAM
jgi:hypothetical protein